jgi:nitrogen fixation NifU-like protein
MQDYSEKVMDHFINPRNVGTLKNPDGVGKAGNAKCGDIMELQILVKQIGNDEIITDAKFRTMGCAAAIATSSMVTEIIKGKTIEKALEVSNKQVAEALDGLPPIKMHCSVLAEKALKNAIVDYQKNRKRKS